MFKKYLKIIVGVAVLAALSFGATKTSLLSANNPATGPAVTAISAAAVSAVTSGLTDKPSSNDQNSQDTNDQE